jgi:hypothetical protein
MLRHLLNKADDHVLRFSEPFPDPVKLLAAAESQGLEGIASKLGHQPYRSGKNPGWVKAARRNAIAARVVSTCRRIIRFSRALELGIAILHELVTGTFSTTARCYSVNHYPAPDWPLLSFEQFVRSAAWRALPLPLRKAMLRLRRSEKEVAPGPSEILS